MIEHRVPAPHGDVVVALRRPVTPLRVAIGHDFDIVVAGLQASLLPYAARVEFLQMGRRVPSHIDVLLQDPQLPMGRLSLADLAHLVDDGLPRLVGFGWSVHPGYVRRVLNQGAFAYLSKGLPAERLVDAIESIARGRRLALDADGAPIPDPGPVAGEGTLSTREAEILALVAEGLSNGEISDRLYLSINTVKTYIRSAYRKIDVTTRAQAVAWFVGQGLAFDARWSPDHHQVSTASGGASTPGLATSG